MRNKKPPSAKTGGGRLIDMKQPCNMKNSKDYEQHSYNSLAMRLGLHVSRTTLKQWIESGKLTPVLLQKNTRNTHIVFHKAKLDQLQKLLEEGYRQRLGRLAKTHAEVVKYRAAAAANALRVFEANKKRRAAGQDEIEEPNPAMNDDDARGRVSLKNNPKVKKLFSGFGLYR